MNHTTKQLITLLILSDGMHYGDFKGFNSAILEALGSRLIPKQNKYLTLGELNKISNQQRIVLATRRHPDMDSPIFWPKIEHKWSGNDITSPDELKQHIART